MKFIPDLPTIRWIAGELVIGYFICLLPVLLTGAFDEQTLMVGLILASMFLIPAEFARLNKAKSKYQEIEIPVVAVNPQITEEAIIASQDLQVTEEVVNPEKLNPPQESLSLEVVPSAELSTTIENLSVFVIDVASTEYNTEVETISVKKAKTSPTASKNIRVFIDAAPPDMPLAARLEKLLGTTFNYIPPIDFSKGPTETRESLEHNLKFCDTVIIPYGHDSYFWLQAQLSYCRRILAVRDQPLTVVVCNFPSPTKTKRPVPIINNFVQKWEVLVLEACLTPIKEIFTYG